MSIEINNRSLCVCAIKLGSPVATVASFKNNRWRKHSEVDQGDDRWRQLRHSPWIFARGPPVQGVPELQVGKRAGNTCFKPFSKFFRVWWLCTVWRGTLQDREKLACLSLF